MSPHPVPARRGAPGRRAISLVLVAVALLGAVLVATPATAAQAGPSIWLDPTPCALGPDCRDRIEIVGGGFSGAGIWLSFFRAGTDYVDTQYYIEPQFFDGSYGFYFVTDLYDCTSGPLGGYGYSVVAYDTFSQVYTNTLSLLTCEPIASARAGRPGAAARPAPSRRLDRSASRSDRARRP